MTDPAVSEDNTPVVLNDAAPQVSLRRTRSMSNALADLARAIDGIGTELSESDAPLLDAKLQRQKTVRPRTLRGDICVLLNPMVRDGVIRGFSTNLSDSPPPKDLIVSVRAVCQGAADDAFRIVTQALKPLGHPILVNVGEPDLSELQAPASGR